MAIDTARMAVALGMVIDTARVVVGGTVVGGTVVGGAVADKWIRFSAK